MSDDDAVKIFLRRSGGRRFEVLTYGIILLVAISILVLGFWINKWANSADVNEGGYIIIYLLLTFVSSSFVVLLFFYILHSPILINVYKDMIKGTLYASLNYFDTTPIAKIIHRLSNDLKLMDKIVLVEYFGFTSQVGLISSFVFSILYIYIKT